MGYDTRGWNKVVVRNQLNGIGGPVREFREECLAGLKVTLPANAPVNNPQNAVHRGGKVGTYAKSFKFDRLGSNQFGLQFRVYNTAPHAKYVEMKRRKASRRMQKFSWTGWGGEIRDNQTTKARLGSKHVYGVGDYTSKATLKFMQVATKAN
jgi:hypothetical protein